MLFNSNKSQRLLFLLHISVIQSCNKQSLEILSTEFHKNQMALFLIYTLLQNTMTFLYFGLQQLIIMLESCKDKNDELSEAELYDLLTEFMRIFKLVLKNSEQILSLVSKPASCEQMLNHLKAMLLELKAFLYIENTQIESTPTQNITFLRFASRLFEIISIWKNKKQQPLINYSLYASFLNRTENFINIFKSERNLGKFFKNFFHLSTKFCYSCDVIMKKGSMQEALQVLSKIVIEQKSAEVPNLQETQETYTENKSQPSPRLNSKESQSKLFFINCLDIDCNYFNSMIFLANNKKDELYRLMFERNRPIHRNVDNYSRDFQANQKKRVKLATRSNRLKQMKSLNHNTFATNFKITNKINRTIDASQMLYTDQSSISSFKDLRTQKQDFDERSQESPTLRKKLEENQLAKQSRQYAFHPVKNVYLTLNHPQIRNIKTHKSTPKNSYRVMDDAAKIYSILKSSKYGFKPSKMREYQFQKYKPAIEIKKVNLSTISYDNDNQKLIQLISLGSQTLKEKEESPCKQQINTKNRKIRTIRNAQHTKTIKNFSTLAPNIQIGSKTSPQSPSKRQIWIKELTLK